MLWPTATLRLLQAQSQPVLWPAATLRLYTANHDNPKFTRALPSLEYFRRQILRISSGRNLNQRNGATGSGDGAALMGEGRGRHWV